MDVGALTGLVAVGVLGLLIGSFNTVIVARVPQRRSVVAPRSSCDACEQPLAARDLVPVASWLRQRGRCRRCGDRIGIQPLAIELSTAAVYIVFALRFGLTATLIPYLIFGGALVGLVWIDVLYHRLPREISYSAAAMSAAAMVVIALVDGDWLRIQRAAIGAAGATLAMGLIYLGSRGGMGDGDVRLMPLIGMHLGYVSVWLVPLGLFLGFLVGAIVGVGAMLFGSAGRKTAMPFGPFLALGAVLAVVFSEPILDVFLVRG